MSNNTMLYKAPGPHEIHGGKFDYVIVDADIGGAVVEAEANGWFKTTVEALDAHEAKNAEYIDELENKDDTPPTREELELKATELGIKFDGRTSDKKLGDLIAATLEN